MRNSFAKTVSKAIYLLIALPLLAGAQSPKLKIPSFDNLKSKATEVVDMDFGPFLLKIARWALEHTEDDDPETQAVKHMVMGLKSVQIRSYEFAADNVYSKSDVDSVRKQLTRPGWSQLVQVRDKTAKEDVDVYVAYDRDKIVGIAIVASDPREFSILNIVGELDLEHVALLQKKLSLPETGATRYALHPMVE